MFTKEALEQYDREVCAEVLADKIDSADAELAGWDKWFAEQIHHAEASGELVPSSLSTDPAIEAMIAKSRSHGDLFREARSLFMHAMQLAMRRARDDVAAMIAAEHADADAQWVASEIRSVYSSLE